MNHPAADSGRTGRRPGSPATRDLILNASRKLFSANGFDKTTIRAIAAEAQVDPALVHHYFGSKKDLILAATELPIDPTVLVASLQSVPVDQLGDAILRTVLTVWDSPAGAGLVAVFRGIVSGTDPNLFPTFMLEVVFKELRGRVDSPKGSGRKRLNLVFSQVAGLGVARKILGIEPLASMPIDEVVNLVGPTIQRYLTGPV